MTAAAGFTALLFWALLTMWMPERWAWSLFQAAVFLLAAWRMPRTAWVSGVPAAAILGRGRRVAAAATGTRVDGGSRRNLDCGARLGEFPGGIPGERRSVEAAPERQWFLRAIVLGGAALATLSTMQYYSSAGRIFWLFPSGYADGVLGPFVNRNQYAAWVELLLPAALWLAMTARRPVLYGVAAAVLLGSAIAGASRAGAALAVAETLVAGFALMARRATPRRNFALWALQLAAFAALAIAIAGWQQLKQRLETPRRRGLARGCIAGVGGHGPRPSLDGQRSRHLAADVPALCRTGYRSGDEPGAQRLGAVGRRGRAAVRGRNFFLRGAIMETGLPVDIWPGELRRCCCMLWWTTPCSSGPPWRPGGLPWRAWCAHTISSGPG